MTDNDQTNGNHHGSGQDPLDEVSELLDVTGLPGVQEDAEESTELEPFQPEEVNSDFSKRDQDYQEDYAKARSSIHKQQQMIEELSRITLESARLSNSPKLVEAFSQLMQRLTSVNEKMMQHQQHTREAKPETAGKGQADGGGSTYNTQNNLTINMTMEELMQEAGTQYDAEERQQKQSRGGGTGTPDPGNQEDSSTE